MLFCAPTCPNSACAKTLCLRETDESTVTRNASNLAAENSVLKQGARSAGFGCGSACNVQGLRIAAIPERQRVPDPLNLPLLGRWTERLLVLADR